MILIPGLLNCLFAPGLWLSACPQTAPGTPAPDPDTGFQEVISDLAAPEFQRRQKAVEDLTRANVEQIELLGKAIESSPSNEIVRRIVEILEVHYQQPDRTAPEVRAASELLEVAAHSERYFVAEAAREILKRHWKRRVELAVVELVSLKASLSPVDPAELWKNDQDLDHLPFRASAITGSDHLKIYVKSSWPKGPRGMELLGRLEGLASEDFLRDPGEITIILVEGHPLTVEEIAQLKGIFGDAPLQERGRVSLGINPESRASEPGVTVRAVAPEGSADTAGIRQGDVITAINGKMVPDFEGLVAALRQFDVGDQMTLTVRKDNGTGIRELVEVSVTLQDWK